MKLSGETVMEPRIEMAGSPDPVDSLPLSGSAVAPVGDRFKECVVLVWALARFEYIRDDSPDPWMLLKSQHRDDQLESSPFVSNQDIKPEAVSRAN
jgi:hypothetical protein